MDRSELYAAWERDGKDRPQFVREYRDDFAEYLSDGVVDALPGPDGTVFEFRLFLNDYTGTVTRQLNDDSGGTDPQDAEVSADA